MKRLLRFAMIMTALVPISSLYAEKRDSIEVNRTAQAIDFTKTIDMSGWNGVSAQAIYSDGTPAGAHSFSSGRVSTATIVIVDWQSLVAKKAQVTIRISSNAASALTGASFSINGSSYTQGIQWNIGSSTLATAQSITAAINRNSGLISTHTLTAQAIITASASVVGSFFNSYTVASSTPTALVVSASRLSGGQDNAKIIFPTLGVTLTQGTDFTADISTMNTALNISTAINANTTLAALIISTRNSTSALSTIFASATSNGIFDYPISVSTPSAILVAGFGFNNGLPTSISTSTYKFSYTNHFFTTGMAVLFSTVTGSIPPANLTNQTTYFVIVTDTNSFQLATSTTNSFAGTNIIISSVPQVQSSYTITAITLSLLPGNGFFWSVSNDNVNFTNFTSATVSSVTYSSAGNSVWDFGSQNYHYFKVNFMAPSKGGIALLIRLFGRRD